MKVELKYEFNLPEDQDAMDLLLNATNTHASLQEIYTICRAYIKYTDRPTLGQAESVINDVYIMAAANV